MPTNECVTYCSVAVIKYCNQKQLRKVGAAAQDRHLESGTETETMFTGFLFTACLAYFLIWLRTTCPLVALVSIGGLGSLYVHNRSRQSPPHTHLPIGPQLWAPPLEWRVLCQADMKLTNTGGVGEESVFSCFPFSSMRHPFLETICGDISETKRHLDTL